MLVLMCSTAMLFLRSKYPGATVLQMLFWKPGAVSVPFLSNEVFYKNLLYLLNFLIDNSLVSYSF